MIIGDVANEGTLFVLQIVTVDDYNFYIAENFPLHALKIHKMYPISSYSSPYYAASAIYGDFFFVCPSRKMAKYSSLYSNVYYYWFDHIPSFKNTSALVYHSSDVSFMFDSSNHDSMTLNEEKLSNSMIDYWTSFAKFGSPFSNSNPTWISVNTTSSNSTFSFMNLNTPQVFMNALMIDEKCDF